MVSMTASVFGEEEALWMFRLLAATGLLNTRFGYISSPNSPINATIARQDERNARQSRPRWISRGMFAMASMLKIAILNSHGLARTRAAMCGTYSSVAIVVIA